MTEKVATAWDQRFSSAARGMRFSAIRRMSALIEKPGHHLFRPGPAQPRYVSRRRLPQDPRGDPRPRRRGLLPVHPDPRPGPPPRRRPGVRGRQGDAATASEVLVTEGSQQGLDLVARVLIDPGDVVLVERPSYIGATSAFRAAQARMVGVRLGPEGLDLDHLRAQYRAETAAGRRVKFLYVIPSFQNPSGHQPLRCIAPRPARGRARAGPARGGGRSLRRPLLRGGAAADPALDGRARPRSCISRRSPRSSRPGCAPRS